jgi:hypothetical protein
MLELAFDLIVKMVWTDPTHSLPGDAQGNLVRKLKSLRANTINWLKWKKVHDTATMNRLELQISFLHRLKARTTQKKEIEANLHTLEVNRLHILQAEENRWRLKSRALWLTSGDNNTRFFHRFASHRRNKKLIWDIEAENGSIAHSIEDIKKEAHNYYKNFFKQDQNISLQDQAEIAQLFPRMVTEEEARELETPCTKEEILQVLKGFKKEKSPGPDGWTVELYLHYFDLMAQDLLEAVEDSRTRGPVNKQLNSTYIVLIPKHNLPRQFSDY